MPTTRPEDSLDPLLDPRRPPSRPFDTGGHAVRPVLHGRPRVLLLEDVEPIRLLARSALERAGYRVTDAADGATGLRLFGRTRRVLRAVVLDLSMPGLGGAEVLRAIRAGGWPRPVLITSGYEPPEALLAAGGDATAFLRKPYRSHTLTAALGELLARRRSVPA